MKDIANWIKVGAVATAAPRWVGALLAAEGFGLPVDWLIWWIPISAILSACMAIVEGLAFAYVFEAWRNQQDKDGNKLLVFALFSAVVFVVVLAPYIAAQVSKEALAVILTGWWLIGWSVSVGLSTIAIVSSVGYAQKKKTERQPNPALEAANTTIRDLRKQLKDTEALVNATEQARVNAEQEANTAKENVRLATDKIREYSERVTTAEDRAGVAEQKASELSAAVGDMLPLFDGDKAQRILAWREKFPKLSGVSIGLLTESSPSYVSEVLNTTEPAPVEHSNGKAQ